MTTVDRIGRLAWPVALGAGLTGCATVFDVEHVEVDAPGAFARPGIYYALPRTELEVGLTVVWREPAGWMLTGFDDCVRDRKLKLLRDGDLCPTQKDEGELRLVSAKVTPHAVPDREQVYRVDPSAGPFMTVNHALTFQKPGLLGKADSKATNELPKTVIDLVGAAAGVARGAAPAPEEGEAKTTGVDKGKQTTTATPPPPEPCGLTRASVAAGEEVGPATGIEAQTAALLGRRVADELLLPGANGARKLPRIEALTAHQVKCLAGVLAPLEEKIADLRSWTADARKNLAPSADPKSYAAAVNELASTQLADLLARRRVLRQAMRIEPEAQEQTLTLTLPARLQPEPEKNRYDLCALLRRGPAPADEAARAAVEGLCGTVAKLEVVIAPLDGSAFTASAASAAAPAEGGYRYRLPRWAAVTVEFTPKPAANGPSPRPVRLAQQEVAIAQFGTLVALPSRFWGSSANLAFSLDSTGALKDTVKLGQQAASAEPLADAIGQLREDRQARADAARARPLDDAKRTADLQEQAVRSAKAKYCAEAWSKVPAQPLPEVCK